MTPDELPFDEVWLHDFEFVARPGERPDVVCLAAHELRSGRTIKLWRDELGERPPYRTDRDVLFVNFVANAECCLPPSARLAAAGARARPEPGVSESDQWPIDARGQGPDRRPALLRPRHDRHEAERRRPPAHHARLAVHAGGARADLAVLRQRRGRACACLLPRILPAIDLGVALHHGEFAAASALMEHHGVPIDMEVFRQLADADTWRAVRDAMVPTIDAQYGVYVRNAAGDWTFNMERFEDYLAREGIAWPRLETGKPNMRRKTFDEMSKGWPQLEGLRQLRHTRDKMRKIKLAVGADGRNRTVLWPFKSKTSRTQPKASQWIFSPAVWLRSLIKPAPGMAVAYIDYSAMEFLIAAVLSRRALRPGNPMLDAYNSGDPYLAFAKRVGAAPRDATKKSHAEVRDKYKVVLLATQYGMAGRNPSRQRWRLDASRRTRCSASTARCSHNIGNGRTTGCSTPCRPG